jgi:alpha-ketoglutarate-dependent taurine dioxygenase
MQRGVVFFRNQDLTLEQQHDFTKHFGVVSDLWFLITDYA